VRTPRGIETLEPGKTAIFGAIRGVVAWFLNAEKDSPRVRWRAEFRSCILSQPLEFGQLDGHQGGDMTRRWRQLIFGIICMVMIANLQYGWTLFVAPIDAKYHWGRAAIQFAFTIFVLTETWLVPIEGYLIDKFGPRIMISGSGILVAIAWVIN
jgi:hypothetical protein